MGLKTSENVSTKHCIGNVLHQSLSTGLIFTFSGWHQGASAAFRADSLLDDIPIAGLFDK